MKNKSKIINHLQEIIKLLNEEKDEEVIFTGVRCQFCKSHKIMTEKESEIFCERSYCLACGRWLEDVKLKKKKS